MESLLTHPFVGLDGYLDAELECDGSQSVQNCPSVYRVIISLLAIQETNGILTGEILDTCTNIQLINDFNHVIDGHIRPNPHVHAQLSHVLFANIEVNAASYANITGNKCNIETCVMMKRNFRDRRLDSKHLFAQLYGENSMKSHGFLLLQILDKIHCYFAHCFEIGHKFNELDECSIHINDNDDEHKSLEFVIDDAIIECHQVYTEKQGNIKGSEINFEIQNRMKNKCAKYSTSAAAVVEYDIEINRIENNQNANNFPTIPVYKKLDQSKCLNSRLRLPFEYFGDLKQAIINYFLSSKALQIKVNIFSSNIF